MPREAPLVSNVGEDNAPSGDELTEYELSAGPRLAIGTELRIIPELEGRNLARSLAVKHEEPSANSREVRRSQEPVWLAH